jgi:hypothetical protein
LPAKRGGVGAVPFLPTAINELTNAALDQNAKIPEAKYCAIRVWLRHADLLEVPRGSASA